MKIRTSRFDEKQIKNFLSICLKNYPFFLFMEFLFEYEVMGLGLVWEDA
jgi:hypothetical protein